MAGDLKRSSRVKLAWKPPVTVGLVIVAREHQSLIQIGSETITPLQRTLPALMILMSFPPIPVTLEQAGLDGIPIYSYFCQRGL